MKKLIQIYLLFLMARKRTAPDKQANADHWMSIGFLYAYATIFTLQLLAKLIIPHVPRVHFWWAFAGGFILLFASWIWYYYYLKKNDMIAIARAEVADASTEQLEGYKKKGMILYFVVLLFPVYVKLIVSVVRPLL